MNLKFFLNIIAIYKILSNILFRKIYSFGLISSDYIQTFLLSDTGVILPTIQTS